MDEAPSLSAMNEQDRRIAEIVAEQSRRLRQFIRQRVPDPADAEDLVQEVFYELVEANRRLMPIEHLTRWLFRVARNRIIDLFRKRRPEVFSDVITGGGGESLSLAELLPSPDAGPGATYLRRRRGRQAAVELAAAAALRVATARVLAGRRPAGAQPDPLRQLVRRPLSRQVSQRLLRPLWGRPHPGTHRPADAGANGRAGGVDDTRGARGVPQPPPAAMGRLRAAEDGPVCVSDPGGSAGARRMRTRDLEGRDDASTIVYERRRKRSAKGWGVGLTAPP
jgi:RNA polymerase sigma factor (sigma-70 family)